MKRGPVRIYTDEQRKARAAENARKRYHADKEYREAKLAYGAKYREENADKYKISTKLCYEKHRERRVKYLRSRIAIQVKHNAMFNKRYPEKAKAWSLLRNAILSGKVVRLPCSVCGNPKSEGHHTDYSKPLNVMWLCKKHHHEQHCRERWGESVVETIKTEMEEFNSREILKD